MFLTIIASVGLPIFLVVGKREMKVFPKTLCGGTGVRYSSEEQLQVITNESHRIITTVYLHYPTTCSEPHSHPMTARSPVGMMPESKPRTEKHSSLSELSDLLGSFKEAI
jgi:hypothetical protein